MGIPKGKLEYQIGSQPVLGVGRSWAIQSVGDEFVNDVVDVIHDRAGLATVREMLIEAAGVAFDEKSYRRLARLSRGALRKWRVGEALAGRYLESHRDCEFPWSSDRDKRTPLASLPGTDLVGFCGKGNEARFAFGEVKTSSEPRFPPRVMYGTDGLPAQLERLRDSVTLRDRLAKYLSYRLQNSKILRRKFAEAWSRYYRDAEDVSLFGVLVRDVPPKDRDLSRAVARLSRGRGAMATPVELLAIYLPPGEADNLTQKIAVAVEEVEP